MMITNFINNNNNNNDNINNNNNNNSNDHRFTIKHSIFGKSVANFLSLVEIIHVYNIKEEINEE